MKNHLIIALILFFTLSLSACNKTETPTKARSNLPTQETEVFEKASIQITT